MTDVTDTAQLNTDSNDQTTTVIAVSVVSAEETMCVAVSTAVGVLGIILGLAVGIVATVLLMRKKQEKGK